MLAAAGQDRAIWIWDLPGAPRDRQAFTLTPEALLGAWEALADTDAVRAYQGIRALTVAPAHSVDFLRDRLQSVPPRDWKPIARWIAELDSDKFSVRQEATRALERQGKLVEPALRATLEAKPPLEVRRRVEALLEFIAQHPLPAEQLRVVRAVEALELAGTPEARRSLETLAQGVPQDLLVQEAKKSLDRLTRVRKPGTLTPSDR
jgi:hypothetical protein